MLRYLFAMFSLTLIGAPAFAEEPLPREFVTCSRIQKNVERLACYDRAVAYLGQPAEQQAAAPSAETTFGLQATVPQPRATEEAKEDEISSIRARVAALSTDRDGKRTMALDNGQTWRELSKSSLVALEVGDQVTIQRAALGSFMMSVDDSRPFRVRRVK
jgi:hypothetical protein